MLGAPYADVLREEGFEPLGSLDYRLHLTLWWDPTPGKRLQVIVLTVGGSTLVKGDKSYYLRSVTPEGETWARDVGPLHDYLKAHFPELRIAFSHFRDVPPELALSEARRRLTVEAPARPPPTVEQVALLQAGLEAAQRDARSIQSLTGLSTAGPDLLSGYLHQQARARRARADELLGQVERQQRRLGVLDHLQREYHRKGSAAVYTFAVSSNLQCARGPQEFRDALRAVVKELVDLHRYQVGQKLGGGRLNVQVAEAEEPALAWIEQWLGGALAPTQLRRLGPEFGPLREAQGEHTLVTPDAPIVVEGHARHGEKHLAARFVADTLRRLDKAGHAGGPTPSRPGTSRPRPCPWRWGTDSTAQGTRSGRRPSRWRGWSTSTSRAPAAAASPSSPACWWRRRRRTGR